MFSDAEHDTLVSNFGNNDQCFIPQWMARKNADGYAIGSTPRMGKPSDDDCEYGKDCYSGSQNEHSVEQSPVHRQIRYCERDAFRTYQIAP